MRRFGFSKRELLRGVVALPLAGLGTKAFAQDGNLLGLPVPKEVLDIIPRKPLSYLRLADGVLRLEREAERKQIPDSILSRNTGQRITSVDDALYQLVLPRLVALIDRAETVDIGLADKAGALLAEIHQSQHELPEALRLAPVGFEQLSFAGSEPSFILPTRAADTLPPLDGIPLPDAEIQWPQRDGGAPSQQETVDAKPVVELPPPTEEKLPEKLPEPEPDLPLSKAKDYATLRDEYSRLYRKLSVRAERSDSVEWHLAMIRKSRQRYENVAAQTGVPWYFIAVTHGLEASFNFRAHLHNGDFPLSSRTRQVPAGRPSTWLPPSDWESSAKDALRLLGFTGQKDWSLTRTLYRLEAYNGFGYRGLGVPTPYLWSFSNQYDRGKYVADGKFSYTARSQQCGAAVMLKMLAESGELKWPDVPLAKEI
jgi:lysozyme family protein